MKTQIKQWGTSKVLVLPTDFIKFHKAEVGDWVDLSDVVVLTRESNLKKNLSYIKENFPSAYAFHIKQNPEDKLE